MKLHKIEMYVPDFEDSGINDVLLDLDNLGNFIYIVKETKTADIGEWSDDHIVNQMSTTIEKFREYFE